MRASRIARLLVPGIIAVLACAKSTTIDFRSRLPDACRKPGTICSVGYTGIGDGGPALTAGYGAPLQIAVDAAGNIFVADRFQNRVRKIEASTGIVSTLAGSGLLVPGNWDGSPALVGTVARPESIAACGGWVYWMSTTDKALWGLDPSTNLLRRFGGTDGAADADIDIASAGFSIVPTSRLSCQGANLLLSDTFNRVVRFLNRTGAPLTIDGVAVLPDHIAVVAGKVGTSGAPVFGVSALASPLTAPVDSQPGDDGRIYVVENGVQVVAIGSDGVLRLIAGDGSFNNVSGDGGPATAAALSDAQTVIVRDQIAWITGESRVRAVNLGSVPRIIAGVSIAPGNIDTVVGGGSPGLSTNGNRD